MNRKSIVGAMLLLLGLQAPLAAQRIVIEAEEPPLIDIPAGVIESSPEDRALFGGGMSADEAALRRQLIELTAARAARMSAAELRRSINAAESGDLPLPPAADEVLDALRKQAADIQADADRKINVHKREAIADLQELQEKYVRDGQLDEAVAVRDLIRALRTPPIVPLADPGTMSAFGNRVGRSFHFRLTGATGGTVYGTGIYTSDSSLATAAVHAGVLRSGQTGIVKVTMLGPEPAYAASTQNGVTSYAYGTWPTSYRLEAVRGEADEAGEKGK